MKAKPQQDRKAYMKAYYQRPEVKEHKKAFNQRPEMKAYYAAYYREKHTIPDAMLSPRVKRLLALAEGWI